MATPFQTYKLEFLSPISYRNLPDPALASGFSFKSSGWGERQRHQGGGKRDSGFPTAGSPSKLNKRRAQFPEDEGRRCQRNLDLSADGRHAPLQNGMQE